MTNETVPRNDVALRILKAADVLMAKDGVQHLSTHKIAKQAGVSVGTIYLYFKDKEALLHQLVLYLFAQFREEMEKCYDATLAPFEQYRALWLGKLHFMRKNPDIAQNLHQYRSLPTFKNLIKECEKDESLVWTKFIKDSQNKGVVVPLAMQLLYAMSLDVVEKIIFLEQLNDEPYLDAMLEDVILRTWKAITI
ncbi:AcrR family transcriptional regulator [Pasteurellaceae bacterium LFhippo2]|nr:AcrR family transcriptional regulator [Pasteurellaceae bacterium LFhippo2]